MVCQVSTLGGNRFHKVTGSVRWMDSFLIRITWQLLPTLLSPGNQWEVGNLQPRRGLSLRTQPRLADTPYLTSAWTVGNKFQHTEPQSVVLLVEQPKWTKINLFSWPSGISVLPYYPMALAISVIAAGFLCWWNRMGIVLMQHGVVVFLQFPRFSRSILLCSHGL